MLRLANVNSGVLRTMVSKTCAIALLCTAATLTLKAQTGTLSSAAGGFLVTGPIPALPIPVYHAGFGNVNGLGIGNPGAGLTQTAVTGGEFYYTAINFVIAGANPGHPAVVNAYIASSFATPNTVIRLMTCPSPGPCPSFSNYTALPTTFGAEITVVPVTTSTGTFNAYLGLFVGNVNGTAVTRPDSATIMFDVEDNRHGILNQVELQLDTPSENVQTAVQLQLATAPSGLTITATGASPDYQLNFGNVNGLGVGPGPGVTVVPGQVAGGSLYTTPYLLAPAFSGFSVVNNAIVSVYVSTNFVHSAVLKLYDSGTSSSGYGAISTSSGAQTQITTSAADGTSITRYLGLFVSNVNGVGSFSGADTATLTYTITVQ